MRAVFGKGSGKSFGETDARLGAVVEIASRFADDGEPLELLYAHIDSMLEDVASEVVREQAVRAATLAWSEAFVSRLNRRACVDPLTGLPAVRHLTTYVEGFFRDREDAGSPVTADDLVLVVIDIVSPGADEKRNGDYDLASALRLAVVAETLKGWFESSTTVEALLNPSRVAVLTLRTPEIEEIANALAVVTTAQFSRAPKGHVAHVKVIAVPETLGDALAMLKSLSTP